MESIKDVWVVNEKIWSRFKMGKQNKWKTIIGFYYYY